MPTVTRLNPDTMPDVSAIGYSQISVTGGGGLAFVSGQVGQPADGGPVPATLEGQTAVVIDNLRAALVALKAEVADIVQMRIYVLDLTPDTQAAAMLPLLDFLKGARPSLTGVGVKALAGENLMIEVEMVVQTV